jgi:radical SAM protein with 4Fe4S-binding SPASM domain
MILFMILGKIKRMLNKPKEAKALLHMEDLIKRRPVSIAVQAFDACNASCVFCARRKIAPTKEVMTLELFGKLCADYSAIGGGHLGFSPLVADPLIDPLFLSRLEVLERFETITPNIFTNGIALADYSDEELKRVLNAVHHIDISIGGVDREAYKTMYRVDKFDIVWAQLKRLSALNQGEKTLKLHIRTNRKDSVLNSGRLKEIQKAGYQCVDIIDTFSSWSGLLTETDIPEGARISEIKAQTRKSSCFSPMYNMMVLQNGRVLACGCMDALEELEIGDIKKESILEIWNSKRMLAIRNAFTSGTIPAVCQNCSYYVPYEDYYRNPGLVDYTPQKDFWSSLV